METTINCPHWREVEQLKFQAVNAKPAQTEVVIVGAGPVGMSLAIDLAQRGIKTIVLDDENCVSDGSRAICWARKTLDIFTRLGIGDTLRKEGVQWTVGRVFHGDNPIYKQQLTPDTFPENPFFVNFQQSLCEYLLVKRCEELNIDVRWQNKLIDFEQIQFEQNKQGVSLKVQAPDQEYQLQTKYLIACDGSKSFVRRQMGLEFEGKVFRDRFLIVDIEMKGDFPQERWFWFEPPFHQGQSTLLHKQPQNVWRIDFQLDVPQEVSHQELKSIQDEATIKKQVRAFLGREDLEFSIVWSSIYSFTCRRLKNFRHGNIFFVGDSAHVVSPFGARGGNGGVQDAENLAWKLAEVLQGKAQPKLLETYEEERVSACDENILHSSRTTDFMTPKSQKSYQLRKAVLKLSRFHNFAIRLVNAGRMSIPHSYEGMSLSSLLPQVSHLASGSPAIDIPLLSQQGEKNYLLRHIHDFTIVGFQRPPLAQTNDYAVLNIYSKGNQESNIDSQIFIDEEGLFAEHYFKNHAQGGYIVFRPDQHLLGVCLENTPEQAILAIEKVRQGVS